MLLVIILSIPSVQTKIATRVTDYLNESYGTDINIHRLGLNWKGEVDIREVYIADHHKDTLIYAQQLQTDVLRFSNLLNDKFGFGKTELTNAKLYFKHYKGEETDNLSVFAEKFDDGSPPSGNVFRLMSDDLKLNNGRVKITDENLEQPEIFDLTQIQIDAEDFKITGPEVEAKIHELSLNAKRGFTVKKLEADFFYTLKGIVLNNLTLETRASKIIGDVQLLHDGKGFSDFENNVVIIADLNNSEILTDDLNAFYDEFGSDQILQISGSLNGTLNNFTFKNADIRTGATRIRGDYTFLNLLKEGDSYKISINNHNITTSYFELRRFMPRLLGEVLPKELKDLGAFNFQGNTSITSTDLVTDSHIRSTIGNADANFIMGNISNFDNAYYRGNIVLDQFNLGKIAGTSSLGKMTADLNFDGSGFTQKAVNTQISGGISSLNFEGYNYKNIKVTGYLKNPLFNGDLIIDDPNLKMVFNGLIDVSKDFNQYDFEADVAYAELNKLNLIKRDSISIFAGKIIMDMDGTTFDDAVGTISLNQTFYQNERDDFYFDDFKIISSFKDDIRTIEINSPDIVQGQISGKFLVADIPDLLGTEWVVYMRISFPMK